MSAFGQSNQVKPSTGLLHFLLLSSHHAAAQNSFVLYVKKIIKIHIKMLGDHYKALLMLNCHFTCFFFYNMYILTEDLNPGLCMHVVG